MFSLFKKKPPATDVVLTAADPGKRMSLEERKAFRREMLYQSIRETFLSMEVIGSMYKFKVMPVDERHHRFIAMIDVAQSFVTDKSHKTRSFAALEQELRVSAYKTYGVMIDATYWRVSETEGQFEYHARVNDKGSVRTSQRQQQRADMERAGSQSRLADIGDGNFEPISEEEKQAFMKALKQGYQPPPLAVGDREYQSDLAPLDGGIMIGGTQYGRL